MTEPVALESIMSCFRGVIPSPFATCAPDGTPNITYMSIVHYVDSDRVALSRQFFNKTRENLDRNPASQVRVVDPETMQQYNLDLVYLHTESEGPTFDAMRTNLDAVASQTGMSGVFRLRGVDVHRVVRCTQVGRAVAAPAGRVERDAVPQLDELTRRVAACGEYEEAIAAALQAIDDVLGFTHAIVLVRDPVEERLFAVAGNGYAVSPAGAEIAVGEGVIGTTAASGHVVCVPNLARSRVMQAAVRSGLEQQGTAPATEIPLPGLERAQSIAAVPLQAAGEVTGVLYLESEQVGRFGPHNERLLRVLGRHLAAVLRALDAGSRERPPAEEPAATTPGDVGRSVRVTYYQADDSVFVGEEYVIKGVPGRILWKLVREHAEHGRTTFTNRELRLDEELGLPPGADNLEARLLVLRKRLAGAGLGIELERVGRGRLVLHAPDALELSEVASKNLLRFS